jgi:hypothetical protein
VEAHACTAEPSVVVCARCRNKCENIEKNLRINACWHTKKRCEEGLTSSWVPDVCLEVKGLCDFHMCGSHMKPMMGGNNDLFHAKLLIVVLSRIFKCHGSASTGRHP